MDVVEFAENAKDWATGPSKAGCGQSRDATVEELPTVTELETLPLDKLSARDAERLFLRILDLTTDVTYAKSYGLPGQRQDGIDVYGRLRIPPGRGDQTRRRRHIRGPPLRHASVETCQGHQPVTHRVRGHQVPRRTVGDEVVTVLLRTTYDLRDSGLEDAINAASERLAANNV